MEMVKFCLGQILRMLHKSMLYSHSVIRMTMEICKMIRGIPHYIPLSEFLKHPFSKFHQTPVMCRALPWALGCGAR